MSGSQVLSNDYKGGLYRYNDYKGGYNDYKGGLNQVEISMFPLSEAKEPKNYLG